MLDLWILTHRRVGDLQQMRTLAAALEARIVEKQISFYNAWLARIMPFLSVLLMDVRNSSPLAPPWPQLILVAEGAVGSIALEVRRRSGGQSKVVCLGRPRGRISEFDLIITTPQFGLAPAPNVLELTLPLHRLDHSTMEKAATLLQPQLHDLPRPWIVLLVGGTSAPDVLDQAAAFDLAKHALARARQHRGSLLVVTSPRTGASAEHALAQILEGDAHVCMWSRAGGSNAYLAHLHLGDSFIVTSDSISMTTEALMTGKPVEVYRLPQRLGGVRGTVARMSKSSFWLLRKMLAIGLIEEKPRRDSFHRKIAASTLSPDDLKGGHEADAERARARVRALIYPQ